MRFQLRTADQILASAREYIIPEGNQKEFAGLLSKDAPLLAYVKALDERIQDITQQIGNARLTTDEGVKIAIELQGKKKGLVDAQEILLEMASKVEEQDNG